MAATEQTFLYLTTRGRVTGQPREIEIWYVEYQGRHFIVSEMRERSKWVQNLLADPHVTFSVGSREERGSVVPPSRAMARVIDPSVEPTLAGEVKAAMDRKYDWSDGLIVEIAAVA